MNRSKNSCSFIGKHNRTSTYTGTETNANVNSANSFAVTLTAKWDEDKPSKYYLFKDGDEYTNITGGYYGYTEPIGGWSVGGDLVNDGTQLQVRGYQHYNLFTVRKPIDTTGYSTFHVIARYMCMSPNCSSNVGFMLDLRSPNTISGITRATEEQLLFLSSEYTELSSPIIKTGNYYVYGYSCSWKDYPTSGGGYSDSYVKEIWLE